MGSESVTYEPVGHISSPYESLEGMPIQPAGAEEVQGTVVVDDAYAAGLEDLAEFSHCILVYHFHESPADAPLRVEPFLDETERGLFATRAPRRPNSIGISVVEILAVDGTDISISGVDVLDGTPLLDIKPFVPAFDVPQTCETGWLESSAQRADERRSDDRFI